MNESGTGRTTKRSACNPPRLVPESEIRPPGGVIAVGGQEVRVALWAWQEWHESHPDGSPHPWLARPGVCVIEFQTIEAEDRLISRPALYRPNRT